MRYRRLDGQPFTLARFKPLQALYEDDWPRLVVMKPAQRGVSEWAISLTFYALECGAQVWVPDGTKNGINVGYIFPARGDLIEFSKERISGLKDESTHMASLFNNDEYDSLSFKQVGNSFLYLRGGYSDAGLRSFPCDLLILDEYDELDPGAVSLARRRLNASVVRREIRISTPTVPGRGISAAYAASDIWVGGEPYEEWTKWTQPKVEASLVELRCPNCHKPQSLEARCKVGRWVSLNPEVTRVHGYHIPWWPWEFLELEQLANSAVSPEPKEVEQLYHSDLGLPYGAGGGGII
jgi:phage terminase large subunit GpA-like protein